VEIRTSADGAVADVAVVVAEVLAADAEVVADVDAAEVVAVGIRLGRAVFSKLCSGRLLG